MRFRNNVDFRVLIFDLVAARPAIVLRYLTWQSERKTQPAPGCYYPIYEVASLFRADSEKIEGPG
jgi:hypothetical protein